MVNDANGIANRESHMIHSVPLSRCYRSFPEVSGFDSSRFGQDPSKTSRRLVLFALVQNPIYENKNICRVGCFARDGRNHSLTILHAWVMDSYLVVVGEDR